MLSRIYELKNFCFIIDKPDPLRLEIENNEISEIVQRKRGDSISIFCRENDRGNPKGALQWNKTSSVVVGGNVAQVSPTALILDFISLKKEDNGTYTCSIGNEIGFQKNSFQFVVLGEVSSN